MLSLILKAGRKSLFIYFYLLLSYNPQGWEKKPVSMVKNSSLDKGDSVRFYLDFYGEDCANY